MRVVKPQPLLVHFSPTQWGAQAQMCFSVGVGFRLSDPRILTHEAAVWEALRHAPSSAPMAETGLPKAFAEWVLAGHSVCEFKALDAERLRDWTAHVRLGKSRKRISVQGMVNASQERWLGRVSVDHTETAHGKRTNPPVQIMGSLGPSLDALAGMTPLDSRWPARRQWMPSFQDGPHLGWPAATDQRYFQQAAPDQWHTESAWPLGVAYELQGFGAHGAGYAGCVPSLVPDLLVKDKANQFLAIHMRQQTLWFLPDQDIGVMWWSGAVNTPHLLSAPFALLVAGLRDAKESSRGDALMAFANLRTGTAQQKQQTFSDVPLLPSIDQGWTWEQILDGAQHPRDRVCAPAYAVLRQEVQTQIENMADIQRQFTQVVERTVGTDATDALTHAEPTNSSEWRHRLATQVDRCLHNETLSHQDLRGFEWAGWQLKEVRFESCQLDESLWQDCVLQQVDFKNCSFSQTQWHGLQWDGGSLEGGTFNHAQWKNVDIKNLRIEGSHFESFTVEGGEWVGVFMHEVRLRAVHWKNTHIRTLMLKALTVEEGFQLEAVEAEGFSAMDCQLEAMHVHKCHFKNVSVMTSKLHHSVWSESQLVQMVMDKTCEINHSLWRDCELITACFIGVQALQVDMDHCRLDAFTAQGLRAPNSSWQFCVLHDAQLIHANFHAAQFLSTSLRGALLSGADLSESSVVDCNLIQVNAVNATRSMPDTWRANLNGAGIDRPVRYAGGRNDV